LKAHGGAIVDGLLLCDSTDAQMEIEGHGTNDPLGLRGSAIGVTLFNALASASILSAIERLADQLQLDPPMLALQPQTTLRTWAPALGADGLGVDVGGRHTTLTLWRGGMLQGVCTVPAGGRDWTAALGRACQLDEPHAEKVKLRYASGQYDPDRCEWLRDVFRPHLGRWTALIGRSLASWCGERALPPDIWMWGGGSDLVDAREAVGALGQHEGVRFAGYPTVHLLAGVGTTGAAGVSGVSIGPMGVNVQGMAAAAAGHGATPFAGHLSRATEAACQSEHITRWVPADAYAE